MSERICKTEGCGKVLHGNSRSDYCPPCRTKYGADDLRIGADEDDAGSRVAKRVKKGHKELRKRFQMLARLAGQDPDELVGSFMESWTERASEAIKRATEDI